MLLSLPSESYPTEEMAFIVRLSSLQFRIYCLSDDEAEKNGSSAFSLVGVGVL